MNADIETMVTSAKAAFEAAQRIIDGMKDRERIQLKDLAKDVGLALALDPKEVFGFVYHFAHNNGSAYVTRGKNGGVIKGVKPVKVVKVKKVKAAPVIVSTDDTDTQS